MKASNSKSKTENKTKASGTGNRRLIIHKAILAICIIVIIAIFTYILILTFGTTIRTLINDYKEFVLPVYFMISGLIVAMILTVFLKGSSRFKIIKTERNNIGILFGVSPLYDLIKMMSAFFLSKYLNVQIVNDENKSGASEREKVDNSSIKNKILGKLVINAADELREDITRFCSESHIYEIYNTTRYRLLQEIESQTTKGIFGLSIGVVTASIGIVVLSSSLFSQVDAKNYMDYVLHFLPRFSLAIIIEIFAYFFLRLYKQSLDEIKYFQNEITNIEQKYMGLIIAKRNPDNEAVVTFASDLMKTERNYILQKGQSTVFLERDRIDAERQKEIGMLLSHLSKIPAGDTKK